MNKEDREAQKCIDGYCRMCVKHKLPRQLKHHMNEPKTPKDCGITYCIMYTYRPLGGV